MMLKTGDTCQHCGVKLSGKVSLNNKAILAEDADKSWWQRETERTGHVDKPMAKPGYDLDRVKTEWEVSGRPTPGDRQMIDGIEREWTPKGWVPPLAESPEPAPSTVPQQSISNRQAEKRAENQAKLERLEAERAHRKADRQAKKAMPKLERLRLERQEAEAKAEADGGFWARIEAHNARDAEERALKKQQRQEARSAKREPDT